MRCDNSEMWIGCYKGDSDLATDESNSHPAKASWGLAFRIVQHLEELGLLRPGDCVVDPMAGTGRFLLAACAKGYRAVGVELEEKFVGFITENKTYAEKRLGHTIDLTIIQGDSRNLSTLLSERGLIMVSSPPYGAEVENRDNRTDNIIFREKVIPDTYGQSPGQIGNMPEGKVIISSPPYEDMDLDGRRPNAIANLQRKATRGELHGRESKRIAQQAKFSPYGQNSLDDYGDTPNQIGQEHGESYWSAMKQVYAESLKVADVMVLVTKDPTRKGKLHPLGQMTADLITSIGWRIVDWHRAILYDTQEQGDLFGGSKKLYKGRVSFFKRLSLQKGSPAAAHEDVIFAVNPNGRRSGIVEVTSPPYAGGSGAGGLNTSSPRPGTRDQTGRCPSSPSQDTDNNYGATPGQIGNMPEGRVIIFSPPYSDSGAKDRGDTTKELTSGVFQGRSYRPGDTYGATPGQIGNLKED